MTTRLPGATPGQSPLPPRNWNRPRALDSEIGLWPRDGRQGRARFTLTGEPTHRAEPTGNPSICRICGRPTRQWPDGRFPVHAQL